METPLPILRALPDELVGPRVILCPRHCADDAAVWEAVEESREELGPWMPWVAKTLHPDDCVATGRRAGARWLLREDLPVAVLDRSTGRYLGGSGLHRIDWEVPAFELGYWLRTSAVGRGYVSEAVRLLCALAFDTLGGRRVEIRCDARNARSVAVPRRLGFVEEGCLRNHCRDAAGELRDTLIFAMTPEDYARVRPGWDAP